MLEELKKYQQKISQAQENEGQLFSSIKQRIISQFTRKLDSQLELHKNEYNIRKAKFAQQVKSLDYYINLYENKQSDLSSVLKNPSINFYSVFKTIDDKIARNIHLIDSFNFDFCFPPNLSNTFTSLQKKYKLLEMNYEGIIRLLFTSQNMKKYAKKQLQIVTDLQKRRKQLNIKINEKVYKCDLKIKDTLQNVIECLIVYEHVEEQHLSIVSNGKMQIGSYEKLMQNVYRHHAFTRFLHLRIMDMQFCQEKCDTIKRFLTKMKLEEFTIRNYYPECKLGDFSDFNWAPYRKKINVKGGVWN